MTHEHQWRTRLHQRGTSAVSRTRQGKSAISRPTSEAVFERKHPVAVRGDVLQLSLWNLAVTSTDEIRARDISCPL